MSSSKAVNRTSPDRIVAAEGSAKAMHKLRKKQGGIVYLAPGRKIGECME